LQPSGYQGQIWCAAARRLAETIHFFELGELSVKNVAQFAGRNLRPEASGLRIQIIFDRLDLGGQKEAVTDVFNEVPGNQFCFWRIGMRGG
jgi:hypothetical protein